LAISLFGDIAVWRYRCLAISLFGDDRILAVIHDQTNAVSEASPFGSAPRHHIGCFRLGGRGLAGDAAEDNR
jgi:hypothetical protein